MWVKYDVIGGRGRVVGSGEGGAAEVTHLSRHDNHERRRRGNHHKVSVYTCTCMHFLCTVLCKELVVELLCV